MRQVQATSLFSVPGLNNRSRVLITAPSINYQTKQIPLNNNNNNNNKNFIVPKAEYYSYLQVVKLIN